ncbi:MAG: RsiV family protein [Oscillibacter sp.]|jgi:hypothetical protein|nr:RsiV family protein [Oscillibacter sp.]
MNDIEKLADAVYAESIADQETIRSRVLAQAHSEQSSPRTAEKPAPRHHYLRWASAPLAACLAFVVLVNTSAAFASAVDDVPVLGSVARVVTFRQWNTQNESVSIQGEQPAVEGTGNSSFEASTNALIEEKISALDAAAQKDAAEYRENWIAMGNSSADFTPIRYDFDYETYYTSDSTLSFLIRQQQTITTNTEDTSTTLFYYNLDVSTGEDLTLQGLLGDDWKSVISSAVDQQIRDGGDARLIAYYQEFWVDKNVPIDETQKFYLDKDGNVVVVFDEGWIAPYENGPQFFTIPR